MALAKIHHGRVDLTDWCLQTVEGMKAALEVVVVEAAQEAISIAMAEYKASANFAIVSDKLSGETLSDDPLIVEVKLPLGPEDGEPRWRFSLCEAISDLTDAYDGEWVDREIVLKVRDALRAQMVKLDQALLAGHL